MPRRAGCRPRWPSLPRWAGEASKGAGPPPPAPGAAGAEAGGGGVEAALASTAGLAGRASTGRGTYLDVSVAEGVLWLMSLAIDEQLALGGEIRPGHDGPCG